MCQQGTTSVPASCVHRSIPSVLKVVLKDLRGTSSLVEHSLVVLIRSPMILVLFHYKAQFHILTAIEITLRLCKSHPATYEECRFQG